MRGDFHHMKKLVVLNILWLLLGCTDDNGLKPRYVADIEESRAVWEELKAKHGGNYTYETSYSSWTGSRSRYEFIVRNNVMYEIHIYSGSGEEKLKLQNKVRYDTVSIENKGDYRTIDEQYAFCIDSVLTLPRKKNEVTLVFSKNGILARCQYRPYNCADDCTMGPEIENLRY